MTKLKTTNTFTANALIFIFGLVVLAEGHLPPFWAVTRIWVIDLSVLFFAFTAVSILLYATKTTSKNHDWGNDPIAIRFIKDEFVTFCREYEEKQKWIMLIWFALCGLVPLIYTGNFINMVLYIYALGAYHTAITRLNKTYHNFVQNVKKQNGIKN